MDKAAKEYYDGISSYADIQNLFKCKAREGLYIDFKTYDQSKDKAEKSLKKNLSEAASGFAHQHGGVIVWGIIAKPSIKNGDCVQGLKPIDNLNSFLSLLDRLSEYAVEPKLKIFHEPIYEFDDSSKDKGFVKSFFPSSNSIHRACSANHDLYQRFGSSNYPIYSEDALIYLINRNKKPKLNLKITSSIKSFSKDQDGNTTSGLKKVEFLLKNDGSEVAEFPSFSIQITPAFSGFYDHSGNKDFTLGNFIRIAGKNAFQFIPKAGFVIHPSQEILIGSTNFKKLNKFNFYYKCFAKNMPVIEGEIKV